MASSIKAAAVVPRVGASSVEPLPCILGDDSSESEGDAMGLVLPPLPPVRKPLLSKLVAL